MTDDLKKQIKEAYLEGSLRVQSVDPSSGKIRLSPIQDILRHDSLHKECVRITLHSGESVVVTTDHSLFYKQGDGISPTPAGNLKPNDLIVTVLNNTLSQETILSIETVPFRPYTFDLSVPSDQNFTLLSGILAHNSYSIGGISLDIERSSKYESLKQNAEGQWDKLTEVKARTTKYVLGLQQPKFGRGVRSAFGPSMSAGVLSPRNFL